MKRALGAVAALATLLVTAAPSGATVTVDADDRDPVELGGMVMTGVMSTFVFQGKNKADAPLSPMALIYGRLGLENLGPGELGVGLSALIPLTDDGGGYELHPWIGYELELSAMELEVRYTVHLTPEGAATDSGHYLEAEATFGPDWPIRPSVGVSWEPVRKEAVYVFAEVSASGLVGGADVLGGSLQVGGRTDATTDFGFADLTLSLSWTHLFGAGWLTHVSVGAAYTGQPEKTKSKDLDGVAPSAAFNVGYLF